MKEEVVNGALSIGTILASYPVGPHIIDLWAKGATIRIPEWGGGGVV